MEEGWYLQNYGISIPSTSGPKMHITINFKKYLDFEIRTSFNKDRIHASYFYKMIGIKRKISLDKYQHFADYTNNKQKCFD